MDLDKLKHYASRIREDSEDLDRRLFAKVAGVTFEGRQSVLARISRSTPIKLERDRRNKFDSYAVEVYAKVKGKWKQAGFVPRPMNIKVARSLDNGAQLRAEVHRVSGGMVSEYNGEHLHYGLEICIHPEK